MPLTSGLCRPIANSCSSSDRRGAKGQVNRVTHPPRDGRSRTRSAIRRSSSAGGCPGMPVRDVRIPRSAPGGGPSPSPGADRAGPASCADRRRGWRNEMEKTQRSWLALLLYWRYRRRQSETWGERHRSTLTIVPFGLSDESDPRFIRTLRISICSGSGEFSSPHSTHRSPTRRPIALPAVRSVLHCRFERDRRISLSPAATAS